MYLVLEGTIQALLVSNGRIEPTGQHRAPTWMGAIGILIETPLGVRIQAETDCRVGTVPAADALDLILEQRSVLKKVMQVVRPVLGRPLRTAWKPGSRGAWRGGWGGRAKTRGGRIASPGGRAPPRPSPSNGWRLRSPRAASPQS